MSGRTGDAAAPDCSWSRGTMLRLRIVSDHRRSLAERSSATFSVEGGTIGRSADNDWVLPDPRRYVSAHHARVQFREGHFYLQDVSTNGVYVNDDMEPLAKRGSSGYRLADGDILRMGEYHIVAALEARQEREDLPEVQPQLPLPDDTDPRSFGQRMARLAEAVGRDPRNGASAIALEDVRTGLDAFCRGAGIEPERLPAEAQGRLLHLAGRLFREALVGFKDLERSRSETRNRYRIESPPQEPDDPRPSLADSMVEELLIALLVQHEGRRLDSVQWLREAVLEAKLHETATAQATRAAFVEFLDRLDPAELEARFERAARRGKARSADKAQYWDLFTTFYRNLIEMPAEHLPHTFVEAFAAAYREASKKPAS